MTEPEDIAAPATGEQAQIDLRPPGPLASSGTGVFVNGRELTEREVAEMDARIDLVRQGKGVVALPPDDPEEVAGRERELLAGRGVPGSVDFDGWRKVMESWGFAWVPAERLNKTVGPMSLIPSILGKDAGHDAFGRKIGNANLWWIKPHAEGQWRSDSGVSRPPADLLRGKEMAFTPSDLVLGFETPEAFDRWAAGRVRQVEIARAREQVRTRERVSRGRR